MQKSRSDVVAEAVGQKQQCAVVQGSGGTSAWEERKREQANLVGQHVCG